MTIRHTLTNRDKGFGKYWIVQEFYKKVAHIRMWGSHWAHCLFLILAMAPVATDQRTPATHPPTPRQDTRRRAIGHNTTTPIFNTHRRKNKKL